MVGGNKLAAIIIRIPSPKEAFWDRHLWARGYLAVSSGNITDEMIEQYIQEQKGAPMIDDSRFAIDPS